MKELTVERKALINQLTDEITDIILEKIVPHNLKIAEGLTVIGTSTLIILDSISEVMRIDKKVMRDMYVDALNEHIKNENKK